MTHRRSPSLDRRVATHWTGVSPSVRPEGLIGRRPWILAIVLGSLLAGSLQSQGVERVSVDSAGNQANQDCQGPSLSFDGRFVTFISRATNLAPGGTNDTSHAYLHDRQTGETLRISADTAGNAGDGRTYTARISPDGGSVSLESKASNLVVGDTNGERDIFLWDRSSGAMERVSIDTSGQQGNGESRSPSLSQDGTFVAFSSWADNLVADDTNGFSDIFLRDRSSGRTDRVSVLSSGAEATGGNSFAPSISADGRWVAFHSFSGTMVAGDTNGKGDVFLHDRQSGQTTRISVGPAGEEGNQVSADAVISKDGRFVAFFTFATTFPGGSGVHVYDRDAGQIFHAGGRSNTHISGDGRFVAFTRRFGAGIGENVFVKDRLGEKVQLMDQGLGGTPQNPSGNPFLSGNGRWAAFQSLGSDLVSGDTNGVEDIFVAPLLTADLVVTIEGTLVGRSLIYLIEVRNDGPDEAMEVAVTLDLPNGVSILSDSCGGAEVPPWTWSIGSLNAGQVTVCEVLASKAPNLGSVAATVKATGDRFDVSSNSTDSVVLAVTSVIEIPTLGPWGLAFLVVFLAAAAALKLRASTNGSRG